MTTYSDLVTSTDAGGTADTFTSVGTVTLNNKARVVHGLWMTGATLTTTAAEANMGQFRWDFSDSGYGRYLIHGPPSSGAGTATQSQGNKFAAVLHPVNIPVGPNQTIECEASTHTPDPTAGIVCCMGVLYSDGHVHGDFGKYFPRPSPAQGADSEATADGSTTTATAITNLEVPTSARTIVGFGLDQNHDAAGANGEECTGYVEFRSTIPDFSPQKYPLPSISAPLAGTLAGSGIWLGDSDSTYFPASIPTPGGNETVTPSAYQVVAVTGAVQVAASVFWIR